MLLPCYAAAISLTSGCFAHENMDRLVAQSATDTAMQFTKSINWQ
jgi:hypothetical protein